MTHFCFNCSKTNLFLMSINTGCPTIFYSLCFYQILGSLNSVQENLGQFLIANFMDNSKISSRKILDQILIKISILLYFCTFLNNHFSKLPYYHVGFIESMRRPSRLFRKVVHNLKDVLIIWISFWGCTFFLIVGTPNTHWEDYQHQPRCTVAF